MADERTDASDPSNLSDQQVLSMSATASCFAVLLCTLEDMLQKQDGISAKEFCESLDRNMEAIFSQSELVNSGATRQAQQWAAAQRQVLLFLREDLENVRQWKLT